MPDARKTKRPSYEAARSAFEKLETQDKVAFVVEATFATLGDAFEVAGREVGSVIEDLADQATSAFRTKESQPESEASEPQPEPEASEPQPPPGPDVGAPRGEAGGMPPPPGTPPPTSPD